MALAGLPADAVGDLLLAAGQAASREQADEICTHETGGNPFLIRELVRMRAGPPGAAPVRAPGRVLEATAYRLTQLSDEAREVLRAAAVAGNSFSVGVVAKMLGPAGAQPARPARRSARRPDSWSPVTVRAISGSRTRWSVRRW